jgi:hypothetical protein
MWGSNSSKIHVRMSQVSHGRAYVSTPSRSDARAVSVKRRIDGLRRQTASHSIAVSPRLSPSEGQVIIGSITAMESLNLPYGMVSPGPFWAFRIIPTLNDLGVRRKFWKLRQRLPIPLTFLELREAVSKSWFG